MESLIGGAIGGIGATTVSEALKPIFARFQDPHRYMLLFAVIFLLFLWFVLLPGKAKRKLR